MTALQILLMIGAYALVFVAAAWFTRATSRRIAGALAGGAIVGFWGLGAIGLGENMGWWRIPSTSTPYFVPLLFLGLAVSCSPIHLVAWRVVRRFGWKGMAVSLGIVAVIGPPRDYLYASMFPAWMSFGPGVAPILGDAAIYAGIVAVGHAVMQLVSGPAREDRLARTDLPASVYTK
jgi:hypothetical protein